MTLYGVHAGVELLEPGTCLNSWSGPGGRRSQAMPDEEARPLRFGWYGRLSTEELQEPDLAFPTQRAACERRIKGIEGISCEFTDVQSRRSSDRAAVEALLAEAASEHRRFDAVVTCKAERFARSMHLSLETPSTPATRSGPQAAEDRRGPHEPRVGVGVVKGALPPSPGVQGSVGAGLADAQDTGAGLAATPARGPVLRAAAQGTCVLLRPPHERDPARPQEREGGHPVAVPEVP